MALTLYGYYKSSCTSRVRIALALKGLAYTPVYIDFFGREQRRPAYAAINPSLTLPTLVVQDGDSGDDNLRITQSVAALEYLDDAYPHPHPVLRPAAPADRARMRALVQLVSADLQPRAAAQTLEMLRGVVANDGAQPVARQWAHDWSARGLKAYEALVQRDQRDQRDSEAPFSVGAAVSLADVCLVPAVWNSVERWGVRLADYPAVERIYRHLMTLPAFAASHWSQQPDAPPEAVEQFRAWEKQQQQSK